MKRLFLLLVLFLLCFIVKAQSDTTVIRKPIQFETEQVISKTGNSYCRYYAIYNEKYYETNKTSMDRYYQIIRFGGCPCTVLITSGKTKKQKIIVL